MKKLKIILQSNVTYVILCIFLIVYVIFVTKVIKYESKLNNETSLTGIIMDVTYKENKISFVIKSHEKVLCNYYVEDNEIIGNLLGKKVLIKGTLKELNNNTIFNTFNYKEYLYQKKIYQTFIVEEIKIIEEENVFYKLKNKIITKIDSNQDIIKTYLNIFLLGDNTYLNDEMYETYRNNGIWHLFAISGMHINLIILILNKLCQKLKIKRIIIYSILSYFMFLTNFSSSVLRATIFYFIKEIIEILKLKLSNDKILILTAFIIILINPFMVYNAGFQYSFLISYSLIKLSKKLTGNYLVKILKISVISFLVSLPITINMNYEINLLSIFLNVLYVPFISFVVFPLSIISFIFPFLNFILIWLINFLEFSNNLFSQFNLMVIIPRMSLIFILIYYLILISYFKTFSKLNLICLLVWLFIIKLSPLFDNNSYVYYLDVNQGDSSILISPHQKEVVMIDTGGLLFSDYKITNNTIVFLKSLGITKINCLIITHGDYDHMGDAINLVKQFKIEKVIFNCGAYNELEQELIKVLDKKKIPYFSCLKELSFNDSKLYFLNSLNYGNENDNSNVIYTEIDNHKFLFMGDASIEVENDLLEKYHLKNIEVLKVGHHGSRTSTSKEFINEIKPQYSIISVGKNNRYNHPNKDVLNTLENSKIYRTDYNGSIMFKFSDYQFKIENCEP